MMKTVFFLAAFLFGVHTFSSDLISREAGDVASRMKSTVYSHRISVDEAEGSYAADCSGFLAYVIKRTIPEALKEVEISPKHKRPLAVNFYNTIVRAGTEKIRHWQRISKLEDAAPGDVLVWVNSPGKDNTGHVMIVMEAPLPEGKELFKLKICDSSKSPHQDDTRENGSNGIGIGIIWIETDEKGSPVAYRWSSPSSKSIGRSFAIGRISAD